MPRVVNLSLLEFYLNAKRKEEVILYEGRVLNVLTKPCLDPWTLLVNLKFTVLGMQDCVLSQHQRQGFMTVLRTWPQAVKPCCPLTIINSWSTSHRLSEAVLLPRIMGFRDCEDKLKHYLCCDPLWALAIGAGGLSSSFLSHPPFARLSMFNKSMNGLRLLSVVFRGHGVVKVKHKELVEKHFHREL